MKRPNKETKICSHCGKEITRNKSDFDPNSKNYYCNKECRSLGWSKPVYGVECLYCKIIFYKKPKQFKSDKHFCSQTCFGKHHNRLKELQPKICKRSKLEKWIADELIILYPSLDFQFNKRKHISYELDIYIPSIKLAIEINGVHHYRPIYGQEKFEKIQKTDQEKVKACKTLNIDLLVIDSTPQRNFSVKSSQVFLDEIINKIDEKISGTGQDRTDV